MPDVTAPSGTGSEVEGACAPGSPGVGKLALRATLWTLAGESVSHAVRLASNLALTRLLLPEVFGLMAVVQVCLHGLYMVSDLGLRPNILQHHQGDHPTFLNTAWTLQAMRGLVLWAASGALAWPVSRFYQTPALAALLPALGLFALIDGLLSTKYYTCERHLARQRVTLLNLGTMMAGVGVMVVWAWLRPSVWALVAGNLAGAALRVALSHLVLPGAPNRFAWDTGSRRELHRFGRWVFLTSILTFAAMQADRLILAKLIPLGMLGVYNIAVTMYRMPLDTLLRLASSVALPTMSRAREKGESWNSAFAPARRRLLVAGGACMSLLILGGPMLIRLLYDVRYREAGWIVQLLAVAGWFQILEAVSGTGLMAQGRPKWIAVGSFSKIVVMASILPFAFVRFGLPGILAGLAIADVPRFIVTAVAVRRGGVQGWRPELATTGAVLLCGMAAAGIQFCPMAEGYAWRAAAGAAALFAALWGPLGAWAFGPPRARP